MPVHFKSPLKASVSPGTTTPRENPIARLANRDLGFISRLKVNSAEQRAVTNIKRAEVKAIENEATATIMAMAEMIGAETRAEASREHAIVLAGIISESTRMHQAVVIEQAATRMSGSIANIDSRNEAMREISSRAQAGVLSQEDVDRLVATNNDLHAESEARIDESYRAGGKLTDRNFELGSATARSILERR